MKTGAQFLTTVLKRMRVRDGRMKTTDLSIQRA